MCFFFKLIHKKNVPLLLGFNHIVVCSSFVICKLLYDLELILFQQLVFMLPLVTTQIWLLVITVHYEWLEFSKKLW
jgi:hypothetical protein